MTTNLDKNAASKNGIAKRIYSAVVNEIMCAAERAMTLALCTFLCTVVAIMTVKHFDVEIKFGSNSAAVSATQQSPADTEESIIVAEAVPVVAKETPVTATETPAVTEETFTTAKETPVVVEAAQEPETAPGWWERQKNWVSDWWNSAPEQDVATADADSTPGWWARQKDKALNWWNS